MKPVRNQSEIDLVKDKILVNALNVIVSEGLSALTMRRLAKETGMTAPNLYNYFNNKDQIHITLMIKGYEQLTEELVESIKHTELPMERAERFMKSYIKFGLTNPNYYEIMFASSSPKYNDYIGTAHEALSSKEHEVSMSLAVLALQLIKEYGEYKGYKVGVDKTKEIMTALWGVLHGLVSLYNSKNIFYIVEDVESVYDAVIAKVVSQLEALFA